MEFESTLQWDVRQGERNTGLRDAVLKTIVAFMNSEGGTLLIGVEDSGKVYGLEQDIKMTKGSQDQFLQLLSSLVADRIGVPYTPYVDINIDTAEGKRVCIVTVSKSTDPAFMSSSKGREFYVRIGNTTRALDSEQTIAYLESTTP